MFVFIQYNETQPEWRKRSKKWADMCKTKAGEPWMMSLISVWPLLIFLHLLVLTLSKYCIRNEFGISWKPSGFSKHKQSSESKLRQSMRKLHGENLPHFEYCLPISAYLLCQNYFQSLIWRSRQEWTTTVLNLIVFQVKLMFES